MDYCDYLKAKVTVYFYEDWLLLGLVFIARQHA